MATLWYICRTRTRFTSFPLPNDNTIETPCRSLRMCALPSPLLFTMLPTTHPADRQPLFLAAAVDATVVVPTPLRSRDSPSHSLTLSYPPIYTPPTLDWRCKKDGCELVEKGACVDTPIRRERVPKAILLPPPPPTPLPYSIHATPIDSPLSTSSPFTHGANLPTRAINRNVISEVEMMDSGI